MTTMNRRENVDTQYECDQNLSVRMNLHARYSVNPKGFYPWLFEQYAFSKGDRILELGCGNGGQWEGRIDALPPDCLLVLSDLSVGMVDKAWRKYSGHPGVLAQRIDIQSIPFAAESFDAVIANHMLYHVPDLAGALSEVRRVLKPGGRFYAATNGNNGMHAYLREHIRQLHPDSNAFAEDFPFSLQNGQTILNAHFGDARRLDYEDALRITQTSDLIDWIRSGASIANGSERDIEGLYDHFEKIRMRDGAICIPKESGLFIAVK